MVTDLNPAQISAKHLQQIAGNADITFLSLPEDHEVALRQIKKLRHLSAGKLIVVGASPNSHDLIAILHAGADCFIDETADLFGQVRQTIDRYIADAAGDRTASHGHLVTVLGAVGGAGATLISANLSVRLAEAFESCGLIDLSGGYGDLATLFELQPRHSLSELCSNHDYLDSEMLNNAITEHDSGVKLIASGSVTNSWEFASNDATNRVIEVARETLPCVVVDLDRRVPYCLDLLEASSAVILLTELTYTAAYTTRCMLDSLRDVGSIHDHIILVANRCRRDGELGVQAVQSMCGRNIDCTISDDPLSANVSINSGEPAVLRPPCGTLTQDLCRLEKALRDHMSGDQISCVDSAPQTPPLLSVRKLIKRAAAVLK
jgi:pilus assembly protein CpaE